MAATQEQVRSVPGLKLDSLSYFSLPVYNLDVAELYYTQVLGAELVSRDDQEIKVKWGPVDITLHLQKYGEPTIVQAHPHHAFTTTGAQVHQWKEHFASWGVPSVIVCRQHDRRATIQKGDPCAIELYFLDPDGNPLELDARDCPFSDEIVWAPYDHFDILYHGHRWWDDHKHLLPARTAA
jgi:catechol-2,3-dioxygenase